MTKLTEQQQKKLTDNLNNNILVSGPGHDRWQAIIVKLNEIDVSKQKLEDAAIKLLLAVATMFMSKHSKDLEPFLASYSNALPKLFELILQAVKLPSYEKNLGQTTNIMLEIDKHIVKEQKNIISVNDVLKTAGWVEYVNIKFLDSQQSSDAAIEILKLTNAKFLDEYNLDLMTLKKVKLFVPMLRGIYQRVESRTPEQSIEDCADSLFKSIKLHYDKKIAAQKLALKQSESKAAPATKPKPAINNLLAKPAVDKPKKAKVIKNAFDLTTPVLMLNEAWQAGNGQPKYKNSLEYDKDFLYVYDALAKNQNDSVAQMMSNVIDKSDIELNIALQPQGKQLFISQFIHQAIDQALELKNGNLYLEPIGLGFDEISPVWLANTVADKVFSLELEHFKKLDIYIPILEKFEKHMEFKDQWQKRLLKFKFSQSIADSLKIDISNKENLAVVNQAVETFLSSNLMSANNRQLITIINTCLREPLSNNASAFQRQDCESDSNSLARVIETLFAKNVFETEQQPIKLADNSVLQLTGSLAIELERDLIKQAEFRVEEIALEFDGGFNAYASKNKAISSGTLLKSKDLDTALMQLALDNPMHANELVNVKVVSIRDVEAALIEAKRLNRTITHFIINTGGHWTRLKIDITAPQKIVIDYVDSIGGKGAWLGDMVANIYPGTKVRPNPLGDQHDGWSCGYHALAGVVNELIFNKEIKSWNAMSELERGIGIQTSSTATLRNWVFNLVTGQSYDNYMGQDRFKLPPAFKVKNPVVTKSPSKFSSPASVSLIQQLENLSFTADKLPVEEVLPLNILVKKQELRQGLVNLSSQMKSAEEILRNVDAVIFKKSLDGYQKQFDNLNQQFQQFKFFACSELSLKPKVRSQIIESLDCALVASMARFENWHKILMDKKQNEASEQLKIKIKPANPLERAQKLNKTYHCRDGIDIFKLISDEDEQRFKVISRVINLAIDNSGKSKPNSKSNKVIKAYNNIILTSGRDILELAADVSDKEVNELVEQFINLNIVMMSNSNELITKNDKSIFKNIPEKQINLIKSKISQLGEGKCIAHKLRYKSLISHRHRLVLDGWKNKDSEFYNALNTKSTTYFGYGFTLFSGSSWGDIINGDSALVRDIKQAELKFNLTNIVSVTM